MSGKLVSLILQKDVRKGKKLLITLASHCYGDQLSCFPGIPRLARECQTSQRQLYRLFSEVKELGYVTVKQRQHRPALFTLCPDKMPDLSPDIHVTPESLSTDTDVNPALTLASLSPDIHVSRNKDEPVLTGKGNRKSFVHPTLAEITCYCREEGLTHVDPEKFFAYYEANGWKVGRNPMKSWKAAAKYWQRTGQNNRGSHEYESSAERRVRKNREACEQAEKNLHLVAKDR